MVFGKAQTEAQLFLIKAIPAASTVLIAGGGTGWLLEEIAGIHPSGLTITYVDSSAAMIALARKRDIGGNKITFITAAIEEAVSDQTYDVVITPFLFDNLTDEAMHKTFSVIGQKHAPNGSWLYCDFRRTDVWWQWLLLKMMYLFFRLFRSMEATTLPDAESDFLQYHYKISEQRLFMRGFIVSVIYQRG